MTKEDREEFELYLQRCTDSQVYGCLKIETMYKRRDYVKLCKEELQRRGLE